MTTTLVKKASIAGAAAAKHVADAVIQRAAANVTPLAKDEMAERMDAYIAKEKAKTDAKTFSDDNLKAQGLKVKGSGKATGTLPDAERAILKGKQAQGSAVASAIITAAQQEGSVWMRCFRDIFSLDNPGRAQMRQDLNKLGKEMAATNKDVKRTAFTRISECMNLSRACDQGLTMENVAEIWNQLTPGKNVTPASLTHAAVVAAQRTFRESKASDGVDVKGPTRRVQMTPLQKAAKYLLSNFNAKELTAVRKGIMDVLGKVGKDGDIPVVLATMFPKAAKTPKGAPALM